MNTIQRIGVTQRYSDIVIHNQTAYFVEVPDDPSQDARHQILQVFAQIDRRLAALGSDVTQLLQVTIFMPDPSHFDEFNRLWESWIPLGHAPSRACIHAQLAAPEYCVELVVTAAVPP